MTRGEKSRSPLTPPELQQQGWSSLSTSEENGPSRLEETRPWEHPAVQRRFVDDMPKELGNGPEAPVWKLYLKKAEVCDREMVEQWDKGMDVLLIFSALFSAVLAAFLVFSLPYLAPDNPANQLDALATISAQLRAMSAGSTGSAPEPFAVPDPQEASNSILWMNGLWLTSLVVALYTAVLAMLVKEWIRAYDAHCSASAEPHIQARQRHFRHLGFVAWKVQDVAESLPLYLHVAVLCFLAGLTVYLWELHTTLAILMTVLTAGGYSGYFILGIAPLIFPTCPYNSGFTRAFESPLSLLTLSPQLRTVTHSLWGGRKDTLRAVIEWRVFGELLGPRHGWLDRRAAQWMARNESKLDTSAFGWLERACGSQEEKETVLQAFWGWAPCAPLWHMIRESLEAVAAAGIARVSWSGEREWSQVEETAKKLAVFSTFAPEKYLTSHPPAWHERLWEGVEGMDFVDEAERQRAMALRVWCAGENRVGVEAKRWDEFHAVAVEELADAMGRPAKHFGRAGEKKMGKKGLYGEEISVFGTWLMGEDARMLLSTHGRPAAQARITSTLLPAMDDLLASSATVPLALAGLMPALWAAENTQGRHGSHLPGRLAQVPQVMASFPAREPLFLTLPPGPDAHRTLEQELTARSYVLHNLDVDHALPVLDLIVSRFAGEALVYPERQAPLPTLSALPLVRQVDLNIAETCVAALLRHHSTWRQVRFAHLQLIALTGGQVGMSAEESTQAQERLLVHSPGSHVHGAHAGISQEGLRFACTNAIHSDEFLRLIDCARRFADAEAASFASLLLYNGYTAQPRERRAADPILRSGWLDLLSEYGFRNLVRNDPQLAGAVGEVLVRFSARYFEYLERSGLLDIIAADGWQFDGVQDLLARSSRTRQDEREPDESERAKELEEGLGRTRSSSNGGAEGAVLADLL